MTKIEEIKEYIAKIDARIEEIEGSTLPRKFEEISSLKAHKSGVKYALEILERE